MPGPRSETCSSALCSVAKVDPKMFSVEAIRIVAWGRFIACDSRSLLAISRSQAASKTGSPAALEPGRRECDDEMLTTPVSGLPRVGAMAGPCYPTNHPTPGTPAEP